jgi:uncharacterized protein
VAFATAAVGALAAGCGTDGSSAAAAQGSGDGGRAALITVSGHGKVVGTPDVMTISLGVFTGGKTAQEALQQNSERANSLVKVLKEAGVAAKDIKTTDLSVLPTYEKSGAIKGFAASNAVTARLHDIEGAGALIDAVTFAVGNAVRLNGISFSIEDTNDLVARARQDAVKKAMEQAEQLADGADVRLGKIRSIDETTDAVFEHGQLTYRAADSAEALQAPIEAGSQDVTLDVKVSVEIEQ